MASQVAYKTLVTVNLGPNRFAHQIRSAMKRLNFVLSFLVGPSCHLGTSWSISRLQLYTATRLEPPGGRPGLCTQPRLSDDRPIVLAHTAVESDRLSSQPAADMQAIIDYCYEGNLEVEFRGQENATRKWFHAPWLHPGLTDASSPMASLANACHSRHELAATQTSKFHNFAVGLYNDAGGYAIGRVWADPNHPDASKAVFPEGTVAFKLLFTTATK